MGIVRAHPDAAGRVPEDMTPAFLPGGRGRDDQEGTQVRMPRPAGSPGRGAGVRPGGNVGGCAFIRMQDLVVFQERGVASKGMGCSFDPSGGSVRDLHRSSGWTEEMLRW